MRVLVSAAVPVRRLARGHHPYIIGILKGEVYVVGGDDNYKDYVLLRSENNKSRKLLACGTFIRLEFDVYTELYVIAVNVNAPYVGVVAVTLWIEILISNETNVCHE